MLRYILKRLVYMIPTLIGMSIIAFLIIQLPPGDYLTSMLASMSDSGVNVDEAQIARSEGEKMAQINIAQGEAGAVLAVAEATARAIQMVADTIRQPGGIEAVNLRVADRYVDAFGNLAKTGNTLIVPANLADVSSLIASALTVVKSQGGAAK